MATREDTSSNSEASMTGKGRGGSGSGSGSLTAPPVKYPEPLPEWLHLLAVLPVDSVRALLPPAAQRVVALAPEYWPTGWSLFDVGRRQIWECEPLIPMIPEGLLRSWIPVAKK